jgi:hypothetical protein
MGTIIANDDVWIKDGGLTVNTLYGVTPLYLASGMLTPV